MNASSREAAAAPARSAADLIAAAAPVVFLLLWSSGFAIAKVGLRHTGPFTFLALRFGLIVFLFVPLVLVLRPALPATRAAWLQIAAVGFLIQVIYFGLAYWGLELGVSAGTSAVISSTQPLVVALASPWLTGEHIGPRRWLGLGLGAVGAVLVVAATTTVAAGHALGLALCVVSMLGMAGATLIQKRFSTPTHPVTVNLIHYLVGFAVLGPLAVWRESFRVDWTPELIVAVGWIAIMNSVVAVSLLLFMIGRSEASRVSALFFLVPPMGVLFGWLLLGEALTPLALAGMAVAAVGVLFVSRS